jgi:hypothetical protein
MIYTTMTIEAMINDLICDEYANWSPQGARALAEYWEVLSDDLGENIEWDRVAMRCSFTEYDSIDDACEAYGISLSKPEHLVADTMVLFCDNGHVIVEDF